MFAAQLNRLVFWGTFFSWPKRSYKTIFKDIYQKPTKNHLPSGYLTVCHGIDGPNRNRWFTELKNGGSFHGYVSHNQRVYIFTINDHPSLKVALLSLEGSDNPSDPRVWGDNLRLTTLETDGVWTKKQCFVFQGLVNVPFWGFVSHHLKKYLLEIISPIVGWCSIRTFTNPSGLL
jgi:hypothetical protein